jgi:hypothetical protein
MVLSGKMLMADSGTQRALQQFWQALGGGALAAPRFQEVGEGDLPSSFAVSDLASASIGAAGQALAQWCRINGHDAGTVAIDRRLASLWFSMTIKPVGWSLPPVWDAIAGDYKAADGWIRLHTNAAHHRAAALGVLKVGPVREKVAEVVRQWSAEALETAVVDAGGCAAQMMSEDQWRSHPQGIAVAGEPLVLRDEGSEGAAQLSFDPARPLAGIRVLDLTRVLAGPVATRLLAGFGAEVLRLDPPGRSDAVPCAPCRRGHPRLRLSFGCSGEAWAWCCRETGNKAGPDRCQSRCLWLVRAMGLAPRI